MGAVVVGPWDGAVAPSEEHDDELAETFRGWAAYLEGLLDKHDGQGVIPVKRKYVTLIAGNNRKAEKARLAELERLRPAGEQHLRRQVARLEAQAETRDRGWNEYHKLREQLKRERHGTPLATLALDVKTRGVLRSANIVTVEELRKATARANWLIKGIGAMRRQEIIDALKEEG